MMRSLFIHTVLVLLALISSVPSAAGQKIVLGMLEDVPGVYYGEPNSRKVRVAFQKNVSEWEALPSACTGEDCGTGVSSLFPKEINWTIAFDGRNLGQIAGRIPKGLTFHTGVLQEITGGTIPTVGKKSNECIDATVYRPIVANSQPYFKDPESWRPVRPPTATVSSLRRQFRKEFPKVCRQSKQDETKLELFLYRDSDVVVVKTYESKKTWTLGRVHLAEAVDCQDVERGFEITDKWFTIDPQQSVHYLGDGMSLVDAGDYDDDGKSELMFCINDDNRGGYKLFYDDFKKHATFEFSYH